MQNLPAPRPRTTADELTEPVLPPVTAPEGPPPHGLFAPAELTPELWREAGQRLLAKMVAELSYEGLFDPRPEDPESPDVPFHHRAYRLPLGRPEGTSRDGTGTDGAVSGGESAGETVLLFRAARSAYGHWEIDHGSLRLDTRGVEDTSGAERNCDDRASTGPYPATDPLDFLVRARHVLGLDGATLGHLLRELNATLAADARLLHTALTSADLAELGYAELEGHQTGHPWIVLNKGRLGFSASDAARWAPEGRAEARLPWLAVRTHLATYRGVPGLDTPEQLYAAELAPAVRESFDAVLTGRGLDPADYLYLPVHPWQWDSTVLPLHAAGVAAGDLVPLPSDGARRLPQQSIRTFLNLDDPTRHTVKLPLSILNTLVWRGLPTRRTIAAPAVTAWVQSIRDRDPYLREECRVVLLGEVASVAVRHPFYDALPEVPYQYKELLGAIWREPLTPLLDEDERARTLASLLHVDRDGRAFTAELVARSGLAPHDWLRRLFGALLPPLLHFLYRHGTVFSPHGENAIVVFDARDVPTRLAVKDFVDDVNLSARTLPEHEDMPAEVRDILLAEDPAFLPQFIHSGLFVGVFRYLAPLCRAQLGVPDEDFWNLVRAEILAYQARFPELKERFELFELLGPEIERLCLNRNRLHLDGYRDRAERPHAAVDGMVANPLHGDAFRPRVAAAGGLGDGALGGGAAGGAVSGGGLSGGGAAGGEASGEGLSGGGAVGRSGAGETPSGEGAVGGEPSHDRTGPVDGAAGAVGAAS
ncbi:IucA/IucC family siderophore biosynthesis protein [Streptomyces sp. GZWMJZ-114]|uniref:IucA/IucC family protein n=1 Tax=Streptomyces sp. GZWMJZ-114 TaxID=2494734 RepID=UPI0010123D2D|nr:IucA/IucC family siderophore biosynthesis protein [Streptomyces sp. GZWMJZ-114]